MQAGTEEDDGRSTLPHQPLRTTDAMVLLGQKRGIHCWSLLKSIEFWSYQYGLTSGPDSNQPTAEMVLGHTTFALFGPAHDFAIPQLVTTNIPRAIHDVILQVRDLVHQSDERAPSITDVIETVERALVSSEHDAFIYDVLTMGTAAEPPHPSLDLSTGTRSSAKQLLAAFNSAKRSLPLDEQRILAQFISNNFDVPLAARQLGVQPRAARVSFRQAAAHLGTLLFDEPLTSYTPAAHANLMAILDTRVRRRQLDDEELLQIARERAAHLYIGALSRRDAVHVDNILQQAELDEALEHILLDVNVELEAEAFPQKRAIDFSTLDVDDTDLDLDGQSATFPDSLNTLLPLPEVGEMANKSTEIDNLLMLAAVYLMLNRYFSMGRCVDRAFIRALVDGEPIVIASCVCWQVACMILQNNLARAYIYCLWGLEYVEHEPAFAQESASRPSSLASCVRDKLKAAQAVLGLNRRSPLSSNSAHPSRPYLP